MDFTLSPNTKAILLLTAPLIVGSNSYSKDLLQPNEYKRFARHLIEIKRQPADLLSSESMRIIDDCQHIVERGRLERLLARGFLLSQVVERWRSRAIWVVSRADAQYPRRLKKALREDAPSILYGCGDITLLDSGGLAIVGPRKVDDELIEYTIGIGKLCAQSQKTVISGGAKGVDIAAMKSAQECGGIVCNVMAENLEKAAISRENRTYILDRKLVLVSAYDPSAGFNVGHAMQRNKLIYALSEAALVVNSDFNKGGTWAGASEQLEKLNLVPVYVRSTGQTSQGIEALRNKGALLWPNPNNPSELEEIFNKRHVVNRLTSIPMNGSLFDEGFDSLVMSTDSGDESVLSGTIESKFKFNPADVVFSTVREVLVKILIKPMDEDQVAFELDISKAQVHTWLARLVEEGVLSKLTRPTRYLVKSKYTPN
jgi:DNA processing protein